MTFTNATVTKPLAAGGAAVQIPLGLEIAPRTKMTKARPIDQATLLITAEEELTWLVPIFGNLIVNDVMALGTARWNTPPTGRVREVCTSSHD